MARKLLLCFDPAQAPTRSAIEAQLKTLGFRLALDEAYAPFETAGYLPCTLDGEDAGFDLRFDRQGGLPDAAQALQAERGARVALARVAWGGDPREALSALAVSAAFAQLAGALIVDPDKGQARTPEALVKQAKALLDEM